MALAPLALALVAVIVACPWYSNFDVDTMTWFEQVRSIADHGSIGFDNGPVAAHPELRTRWFVAAHGRAWGILPAPLCYLLAPAMKLGGYKGAVRAIWALLGLAAAMTYALVHRMTGKGHVAVGAAYALVLGSSMGFWATTIAPFVPAAAFGVTAVYLGHRSFGRDRARHAFAYGFGAGLFAGFALGSHLLFAIPVGLIGLACVSLGAWPHRVLRGAAYGLGAAPSVALMAWVNHQRFNSWNPISYGPCNAITCTPTENNQTATAFLEGVKPFAPYALAGVATLWLVRRSARAVGVVVLLGLCAALVPDHELARKALLYARALWGFVGNFSSFTTEFRRAEEGVGVFNDGWCVRSLLQCSPALVLCALGARAWRETATSVRDEPLALQAHAARRMLTALVVGVLAGCVLRADAGGAYVWGWPFLNLRYVVPLLPAAVVLGAVAVAELPWSVWHVAAVMGAALWGVTRLRALPETDVDRQWETHVFPLWLAAATFALVAWAQARERWRGHVAAVAVTAALAYGMAVTLGIDADAARKYRGQQTERTRELERCTSGHRRFLLLGGYAMDAALALHDRRDITIINVGMGPRDGSGARDLVLRLMRDDRPAFLVQDDDDGPWWFEWEGLRIDRVAGCARVYRITREPRRP